MSPLRVLVGVGARVIGLFCGCYCGVVAAGALISVVPLPLLSISVCRLHCCFHRKYVLASIQKDDPFFLVGKRDGCALSMDVYFCALFSRS